MKGYTMKKLLPLFLSAILLISGCSENTSSAADSKENSPDNTEKPVITIGITGSISPMSYMVTKDDKTVFEGFDIDLAGAVCDELGMELKITSASGFAVKEDMEKGIYDCYWNGVAPTEELSKSLDFTSPYFYDRVVFGVYEDSGIETTEQLSKSSILTYTELEDVIFDFEEIQFPTIMNIIRVENIMEKFKGGQYQAVLCYESEILNYNKTAEKKLSIIYPDYPEDNKYRVNYCVGVKKGNEELKAKIETAIATLKENGKFEEIYNKWF